MTTMDVEIGLARPEDRERLWELYRETALDAYVDEAAGISRQALTDFLKTDSTYFPKNWQKDLRSPGKHRTVYVAKNQGKIVGMVAPVFVDGNYRITGLYVDPAAQHMGVGTKLMETALAYIGSADVYIGVASHLKHLPDFYEPFGFRVIDSGKTRQHPPDPISYVEMLRPAPTD